MGHRKNTPKRARRSLTGTEIAAIIAAFGTLFTGLAALLTGKEISPLAPG